MNQEQRSYKTNSKTKIAMAYGITEVTLVKHVRKRIERLTDEQLLQLGEWTGPGFLLPDQVEIVVFIMGKPELPEMIYT